MKISNNPAWVLAAFLLAAGAAPAQTAVERVIHAFGEYPQGAGPHGRLVRDASGNLYGTASGGGAANDGVVFKLTSSGMTVLHSFQGGTDGAQPFAGPILDSAGNICGTTYSGGPANAGIVYKLSPSGQESIVYSFTGGVDGGNPYGELIVDSAGNLYGTAYNGGAYKLGVVFKLDPSGHETVLHSFAGTPPDGANPWAGVVADAAGNLYGTTFNGGSRGAGTVYKLAPSGQETVLFSFGGQIPGFPEGGVILDDSGNLYGATAATIYEIEAGGTYKLLKTLPVPPTGGNSVSTLARDAAGNLYGTAIASGAEPSRLGSVFKLDNSGTLTILQSFTRTTAGAYPYGGVTLDAAGNLYGGASGDGAASGGVIYEITASGDETTLFNFAPALGGTTPWGGVVRDAAGNFYGTTYWGGKANAGVVFKISATGQETVLHTFSGGADGAEPSGTLALDSAGNLYGTTDKGGSADLGAVYRLNPSGEEMVLHSFTGQDGWNPDRGVLRDSAGNLYGTTFEGGGMNAGLVFKIDPAGQETVLYSFTGGPDGGWPEAGVIMDPAGNLYGTTSGGGPANVGVVYKLDAAGNETVLYSFTGFGAEGGIPGGGVIRDSAGNLYGTAAGGGVCCEGRQGSGLVFKLDTAGNYTVLYTFTAGPDGGIPQGNLTRDSAGNIYGTTEFGGDVTSGEYSSCYTGCGVVFKLSTAGQETVLYSFTGGADGDQPLTGVVLDKAGNLYGTTHAGGAGSAGVLFELQMQ